MYVTTDNFSHVDFKVPLYRTVLTIFCMDSELMIFWRAAPRIMVSELTGELPSSETAFRANTCHEWHKCAPEHFGKPNYSIAKLVEQILNKMPHDSIKADIHFISTYGLQTALYG